jgi:hypothetical protein
MNLSLEKIINEYFMIRQDGGVKFNIKNRNDFLDFESFLIKNNYNSFFKENTFKQLFENSVDIGQTSEYVKNSWRKFMGTDISELDLQRLTDTLIQFKTNYPNQTMTDAFSFLKANPYLLSYQKKEVGEGEFALFFLVKGADKIPKGKKGDISIGGISYEIKKIKSNKESIRFGTNLNLKTINYFNKLILSLDGLLRSDKYKEGETVKTFEKMFLSVTNYKDRSQSTDDDQEGSRASWTVNKIKKLYEFLKKLNDYTVQQKNEKSISSSTTAGKNFIFKANDLGGDVYFKVPFDDIKKSAKFGKTNTQIEPTSEKQDTEELVSFSEDLSYILKSFLSIYPDEEDFGKQVVKEINQVYNTSNLKLIIIDQDNNFLFNPEFNFHSINQYFRPQVTLK